MAKFNPTIGSLSGKTGGLIYAFNRGGYYVRNYVKQHWYGSNAQITAKNYFIASNTFWSGLSDIQKIQWNEFARLFYLPLYKNNGTKYNGHDAAIAAQMTCSMTNLMLRPCIMKCGFHNILCTKATYILGNDAPNYRLNNIVADYDNNPLTFPSFTCTFSNTGVLSVIFNMSESLTRPFRFTDYINGEKIGFGFYCSNGLTVNQTFYKRPLYFLCATTGIITPSNYNVIPSYNTFLINFTFGMTTANYKVFPVTGNKIRITAFIYDTTGQKALIGSYDTVVT